MLSSLSSTYLCYEEKQSKVLGISNGMEDHTDKVNFEQRHEGRERAR